MDKFKFEGLGVALVTPFKSDKSIDYEALGKLIDFQISEGIDYIVVLGTTGETPTLSFDEQISICEFVKKRVKSRVPLVMGLGGYNTQAILDNLQKRDFSGFEAILSVVPPYNKPSQEGIYQHFAAIAKASPLPIILYNIPSRTGVNMTAETTLRLAKDFKNIIAVKEASGNFGQIEEIIKNKPDHFEVISGDDGITYPLLALGAKGVISVIGNAFPKDFGRMVRKCLSGDFKGAFPLHLQFTDLFNLLFVDGNPAGVKCTLNAMGMIENELRLPLVPTRLSTYEKIHSICNTLKNS